MTHYADDDTIGHIFFREQTFPSDNTVATATHAVWQTHITSKIKSSLNVAEADDGPDDTYGNYRRAHLWLYERMLNGLSIDFAENSPEDRIFKNILNGKGSKSNYVVSTIYKDAYGRRYDGGSIPDY